MSSYLYKIIEHPCLTNMLTFITIYPSKIPWPSFRPWGIPSFGRQSQAMLRVPKCLMLQRLQRLQPKSPRSSVRVACVPTRIVGCSVYCFAGFRIHLGGRPLVAPWVDGHFVVVSRLFVGVSQRKESIKNRNGRERGPSFFLKIFRWVLQQISSRLEPWGV